MSRMLVTGANGFIGSALCRELLKRGDYVVAITRSGSELEANRRCQVITGVQIDGDTDWSELLEDIDCVFHLAARVHVMSESSTDPRAAFFAVNVDGTRALARAALERQVSRFVFVSSVKVNGEATGSASGGVERFRSDDEPRPDDEYGRSKLAAEVVLQDLTKDSAMELVIVRPPLVYGAGVGGNFLRLITLVKSGLPLPLGGIRNLRSMIGIDNLVDFLILCANHPAAPNNVFLVSDDRDLSTPDLVRQIAHALHKTPRVWPIPAAIVHAAGNIIGRAQDVRRLTESLQVDSSPASEVLGWSPKVTVEEGVRRAVIGR